MRRVLDPNGKSTRRNSTVADEAFIARAIDLAWLGAGRTRPNPLVGAVVAGGRDVVGEGFHAGYGLDHAEEVALEKAGERARGGTLYVTLEPCAHHGNTPPCVDRIIESGVRRVVVSTLDPDSRVDGRGISALREAGIDVAVGCCAERALLLNIGYFKQKLGLGRTVTLKMATSLDGCIASRPGTRSEITGQEARRFVHRLRAEHRAVLVGIDTLLVDRPRLDCRLLESVEDPVPVVLDSSHRFPDDYRWSTDERPFVVASLSGGGPMGTAGEVIECDASNGRIELGSVLARLEARGLDTVLVEGGAEVFTSFLERGEWDALHFFLSARVLGPGGVSLTTRTIDGFGSVAVSVATAGLSNDALVSFIHTGTRDTLLSRVLEAG